MITIQTDLLAAVEQDVANVATPSDDHPRLPKRTSFAIDHGFKIRRLYVAWISVWVFVNFGSIGQSAKDD